MKKRKKLNIAWYTIKSKTSNEKDTAYLANMLSIYSLTPIKIENIRAESLAGFLLGIYFPENSTERQRAFRTGESKAICLRQIMIYSNPGDYIYWKGETIRSGSKKHYEIIEQAIRAKFEKNEDARKALISVYEVELSNDEHNIGGKFKISPSFYCKILTTLCNEFVQKTDSFFLQQTNKKAKKNRALRARFISE